MFASPETLARCQTNISSCSPSLKRRCHKNNQVESNSSQISFSLKKIYSEPRTVTWRASPRASMELCGLHQSLAETPSVHREAKRLCNANVVLVSRCQQEKCDRCRFLREAVVTQDRFSLEAVSVLMRDSDSMAGY